MMTRLPMPVPDGATMSTEEKVGQMMMVRYPDRKILETMLRAGTAGAFYFGMKGLPAADVAETLNRLQAVAKVPALVAFGSATTSCGAGLLRGSQMRIGATRSPEIAYQIAYREACEQRAYGYHIINSPVLDVNTNPANPIINTRAFGDDPELVTELGLAMLQGIIDARAVTCGMHFPGHGATADDSHIRVPVDSRDADTLWRIDLLPFRRVIERNLLNAVCTNHVHYPALTPGPVEPWRANKAVSGGGLYDWGACAIDWVLSSVPFKESDWATYYRELVDHLLRGAPIPVSGEDGRRVITVLETAEKSSKCGKSEDVPFR